MLFGSSTAFIRRAIPAPAPAAMTKMRLMDTCQSSLTTRPRLATGRVHHPAGAFPGAAFFVGGLAGEPSLLASQIPACAGMTGKMSTLPNRKCCRSGIPACAGMMRLSVSDGIACAGRGVPQNALGFRQAPGCRKVKLPNRKPCRPGIPVCAGMAGRARRRVAVRRGVGGRCFILCRGCCRQRCVLPAGRRR